MELTAAIIALIDCYYKEIINTILHHPNFQQLESLWLGLQQLTTITNKLIMIKTLDYSRININNHLPHLKQLITNESDCPGGYPFSLLVSGYYFSLSAPNDLQTLTNLNDFCSSLFLALVAGLTQHKATDNPFTNIVLITPRVLARKPYQQEEITNHNDFLWINPSFAYGLNALLAFQQTGWFTQTQRLTQFPHQPYATECLLLPSELNQLHNNKLLALVDYPSANYAKFQHHPIHLKLCLWRFVHTIKAIARNQIGKFLNASQLEQTIQRWLLQYCANSQANHARASTRYPLKNATIDITPTDNQQHYSCTISLTPNYQLEQINMTLTIQTILRT